MTTTHEHKKMARLLPTTEQIAAEKQRQREAREAVTQETGVVITDDGRIALPKDQSREDATADASTSRTASAARGVVRIHCVKQGCPFKASARNEGRAINALAAHLLSTAHMAIGGAA